MFNTYDAAQMFTSDNNDNLVWKFLFFTSLISKALTLKEKFLKFLKWSSTSPVSINKLNNKHCLDSLYTTYQ